MFNFNKTLEKNLDILEIKSDDEMILEIYHKRKLRDYSNYELSLMVEAAIGLDILIPFAIDLLQENIFSEGDAELLNAVFNIDDKYWQTHTEHALTLKVIIEEHLLILNNAHQTIMSLIKL